MADSSAQTRSNTMQCIKPRRDTVLDAALASGMCLDMMIERLLDRVAEDNA